MNMLLNTVTKKSKWYNTTGVQYVLQLNILHWKTPNLYSSGSDGLEHSARTQRSSMWCWQLQTVFLNNLVQLLLVRLVHYRLTFNVMRSINFRFTYLFTYLPVKRIFLLYSYELWMQCQCHLWRHKELNSNDLECYIVKVQNTPHICLG